MRNTTFGIAKNLSLTDLMIFHQRWWQHILFWGAVLFIMLNLFRTSSSLEKIDLIYTLIFLVPLLVITYLNLYHFIPRYLRKEQTLLYGLFFALLLVSGALFLYLLFDRWIDYLLPGYYFISYYSVPQLMLYTGSILLLTTLLKLSRSWFMLLRLERMTASHQLQALQSQINPHFLLNSLQTIYALSLEKSERTPRVILQLSDILKYTLYETAHPLIGLEKEMEMIKVYVAMYRNRVDPVRADIRLNMEGNPGDLQIAPMLLIPFIENGFKHGLQSGPGNTFVHIFMEIRSGRLEFSVVNNLGTTDGPELEKRKGIGIENTKQRLQLLYPGRHQIEIKEGDGLFKVELQIELEQ